MLRTNDELREDTRRLRVANEMHAKRGTATREPDYSGGFDELRKMCKTYPYLLEFITNTEKDIKALQDEVISLEKKLEESTRRDAVQAMIFSEYAGERAFVAQDRIRIAENELANPPQPFPRRKRLNF